MAYLETRVLNAVSLRSLCIQQNWYTCGNNAEYAKLFDRLHDADGVCVNLTTEKLAEIAQDIYDHSDLSGDYTLTAIMFELARNCTVYFDEV